MTGPQLRTQNKDDVRYRPQENPGENCGVCRFFRPPNSCSQVAGTISESYVCDLFSPARGGLGSLIQPSGPVPGGVRG